MSPIALIDLKAQAATLEAEMRPAINAVLAETAFIGGRRVREFEQEWAAYCGLTHALGCANGTDALELVLDAAGIGPGDEVVVPAMSWISTSEVVATRGAQPVFVDIDPESYCLDPALVARAITPRTRAIIAVHLYGHPAAIGTLRQLADAHELLLIEDCAQAHGARWRDRGIATFGHVATFSFFPSKSLGAYGDAGAVVTDDAELYGRMHTIAHHGMPGRRHVHTIHGRNSRLDALQAAVLSVKLPHLDSWIARKNAIAEQYRRELRSLDGSALHLPKTYPAAYHGYHLFVIRCSQRDALAEHLAAAGIATAVHYPTALPFHLCYADAGYRPRDFPVAYALSQTGLSLPMYAELTHGQLTRITTAIREFFAA